MKDSMLTGEPMHGHGLAEDLSVMATQRRRVLSWLTSAAGAALMLRAGDGLAAQAAKTCTADAAETNGPYPADGTNQSMGATSDILTASGIVRSDIRSSFLTSTTVAPGVPVAIRLRLVDTNSACAALAGRAIYIWHCDRSGDYSLYTAPDESYLRGVQVTDAEGYVTFVTIFPACYSGRWPHIHFEVFSDLAAATNGTNAVLTSQLALPSDICSDVYDNVSGYSASIANFAAISLKTDNVFGDDTVAQLRAMTPKMKGAATSGYFASATIGMAA